MILSDTLIFSSLPPVHVQEEHLVATDLPIDSPSENMLKFMRKHYCAQAPIWQSNNFVVFPLFFAHVEKFMKPRRMRSAMPCVRPSQASKKVGPGQASLATREIPVRLGVCSTESTVQISPSVLNVPLPGAIESASNSPLKTDSSCTKPSIEDTIPSIVCSSSKVINVAAEKLPSPEVSRNESIQLSSADQSSMNTPRLAVQNCNPLLSLKHFETICQLSVRPRSYSYQSAVRTHNKHTRLW
uniref:Alpha-tubulin N-acetyltransferase 1 n=1 Tax=Schistocephalus solidus TaxID=70667 RepID=A0A0X3NZ60_SCHSO